LRIVARVARLAVLLVALPLLAGCGKEPNRDVTGFVGSAESAQERAILSSIATYRTTPDESEACELVTARFLDSRFEGELDNCHQLLRAAPDHLPDEARVESVEGGSARVFVDEPTSTSSFYEMRREGGTWKIDDIVENA
jgi:hypothetical protein